MPWLDCLWYLPFFLYAETHYRFRGLPSFLFKREPEIIADAPHRLEPGHELPVLILVKDAHLFPWNLQQVSLKITQGTTIQYRRDCLPEPVKLEGKVQSFVYLVDVSALKGWIELDVVFTLERHGRRTQYQNDNYRTSSHGPLKVFLADEPLPRFPTLHLGDPHVHSFDTSDQVEFGAPIPESRQLARAMGLSYFCVTDHSYDLDDRLDSFLHNDPELPKWRHQQEQIDGLNQEDRGFVVVRGEEISCRNSEGKNVHLLLFGQKEFIRGAGDSAEKWLHTRSEHSIEEAIRQRSEGSAAFAAHAMEPVPFLQRLLLGRGVWSDRDLATKGLAGFQIFNGTIDKAVHQGYHSWISHLLAGRRLTGLAGNDAHGNFNRFRQIGVPFLKMREEPYHLFGKMRTGVFVEEPPTERTILEALLAGRSIMTDGPVAQVRADRDLPIKAGDLSPSEPPGFEVTAKSTREFGALKSVRVIVGSSGSKSEVTAFRFDGLSRFDFQQQISLKRVGADYVRVEVDTRAEGSADGMSHFCFTNPLWLEAGI